MSDMKQPVDPQALKTGDVIVDRPPKPGFGEPGDDPIPDVPPKPGYGEPGDDPIPDQPIKPGYGKASDDPSTY